MTNQTPDVSDMDKVANTAAASGKPGLITVRQPIESPSPDPAAVMGLDEIFSQVDDELDEDNEEDDFVDPHKNDTFELRLHSADAQALWKGMKPTDKKKGFPGVEWYTRRVGRVCRAVRDDDPYAIMALQDMEYMINAIRRDLNAYLDKTDKLLTSGNSDGIVYRAPSKRRFSVASYGVSPTNGYAFAAIQLVGRFDQVVQHSMQARDMGLISSKELSTMKNRRPFRQLTWSLARYQLSGTTREDFRNATARAREAVEKYGAVTEDVLDPDVELLLMEIQGPGNANRDNSEENSTQPHDKTERRVVDA